MPLCFFFATTRAPLTLLAVLTAFRSSAHMLYGNTIQYTHPMPKPHAPYYAHTKPVKTSQNKAALTAQSPTLGLATTSITESPRKNILAITRSLFTPRAFFRPFPPPPARSVHISVTPSSTMFMWRSKALTRASSLRLLRRLMRTGDDVETAVERRESGPLCKAALGSAVAEVAESLQARTEQRGW